MYEPEKAGNNIVERPRVLVHLQGRLATREAMELLDSGADRTIIPLGMAEILSLPKGRPTETSGVGGYGRGYESILTITFIGKNNERETVHYIPVYVLDDWEDIVIGRNTVFDHFRIIFEQYRSRVFLEPIHGATSS